MTHYIFLSREQRYALIVPESEIEVIGVCTPVWIQNGRHLTKVPEEIFVKYRIRHCPLIEEKIISYTNNEFSIKIFHKMSESLLDIQDEGTEHLNITYNGTVKINNTDTAIVHLLKINDSKILEETLN